LLGAVAAEEEGGKSEDGSRRAVDREGWRRWAVREEYESEDAGRDAQNYKQDDQEGEGRGARGEGKVT
jgi:hypothetical protein